MGGVLFFIRGRAPHANQKNQCREEPGDRKKMYKPVKKLLFSLMAVALCSGMVGSSFAYFTDVETSTGNTFTAGTLELKLRDGGQEWSDGITVAEWTLSNMAPGVPEDFGGIRSATRTTSIPV